MTYDEFYQRFGGSYRKKHIEERGITLPAQSELPEEFIRLCPWEGEYLFNVARQCQVGILEIGRARGGSTFVLSCAAPNIPIHSIDISPKDDDALNLLFKTRHVGANVDLIIGNSRKRHRYDDLVGDIDLLFIDGDHRYDGCHADITYWHDSVVSGGHIILHDSHRFGVQTAGGEYIGSHKTKVVLSPYVSKKTYWELPHGSLAHFVKP